MIKIQQIDVVKILTPCNIIGFDYTINPYVGCTHACVYCYAEFMKIFTKHSEPWGQFLDIKNHSEKFTHKKLHNKSLIMSTVTDAYNHFEAKHQKTRQILTQLLALQNTHQTNFTLTILTKSDLVTRDIDLLTQFKNISVGLSLNTTDDSFRKIMEPQTPSVDKRIDAIKFLHNAGLKVQLFASPVYPYITNVSELYKELQNYIDTWCFENLNLRGAYKQRVLDLIKKHYPNLYPKYQILYAKKNDNRLFWDEIATNIREKFQNIPHKLYFYHDTHTK